MTIDEERIGLLVLTGNIERLLAIRSLEPARWPEYRARLDRYLVTITGEVERLRRARLACLGELQFAAEQGLNGRHAPVRAARRRLQFAERMLLRTSVFRRELLQRQADIRQARRSRVPGE